MKTSTLEPIEKRSSDNPEAAIAKIAYPGQPLERRMYKHGYENYFDSLPKLADSDENLSHNISVTKEVMKYLAEALKKDISLGGFAAPGYEEFHRTIIALEEPTQISDELYREGAELVVAQWGLGHTSPIHGHSTGYMHEEILSGRMRVNTYRIVDELHKIVRFAETTIQEEGVFVQQYAPTNTTDMYKRQTLVHNFTAVEPSVSLHYLPEHTRDGRDNTFTLEEFRAIRQDEVARIDSKQGLYTRIGEVVLVRSTNVPEYGDHFIVITGHPVMKKHGFRPQDRVIAASGAHSELLSNNPLTMGLTLLKLNIDTAKEFLEFHGITVEDDIVIFPND